MRHGGLQVKHQPVFTPSGQQVQARADQAEQGLIGFELAHFKGSGQPLLSQRVPAAAKACGARHPQHHLQVAQAARRLFAVGL